MGIKWWHVAVFVAVIIIIAALLHPTRLRMGWMFVKSGRAVEAIEKLTHIFEKDPGNYRALKYLAEALEKAGRPEEAKKMYENLLKVKPREENFREVARFYMWNGKREDAKWAYGKWFDARREKRTSFSDDEGQEILDNLYALCLEFKDHKKAIEVLEIRKEQNPGIASTIDNDMITLYEMTGDLDATMAEIERVMGRDKENTFAVDKYLMLAPVAGKAEEAKGYLIRMMNEDPGNAKKRKQFIDYETNLKDYASANEWYRKWIAASPGDRRLQKEYLDWLLATEQQKEAISFIEGLPEDRREDLKDTLVELYEWNNMKDKLVEPYYERFRENPSDQENAKKLVWLLIDLKQDKRAAEVLKRLVESYPSNPEYAAMLADIYDSEGRTSDSISTLERAVDKKKDPKLMKRLGELYLMRAESR